MPSEFVPVGWQQRILIYAPDGRDSAVIAQVLAAQQIQAQTCLTAADLLQGLREGAGAAFVTEEALGPNLASLAGWIAGQPSWSDFPFIVLVARRTGRRPAEALGALSGLGNVVLLERPLHAETLVTAARSALRARSRQYEGRRHLLAEAEARLAEQSARADALAMKQALELALDAGELGTFHCVFPLRIVEWNARCKAHFWLSADAEVDLATFYAVIHADDRAAVQSAIDAAVAGPAPYDIEFRTVSPAGDTRWLRVKGRVYRDAVGEPLRFDGVTLDISRQKRLELEREQALSAEREARLEAERAGRMKDQFLATLSHELRTPLSAILGWTHMLRRAGGPPVDVDKAATTIERNARAQARLIEELLDVSRIASGKLTLDIQAVSLAAVFEAVLQSVSPAQQAKNLQVAVDPDSWLGHLPADPGRLQQIVWNLVSNAVKFTPAEGRVTLKAERDGADVVLSVKDTGSGIPPAFLPHVFERFRQSDSSEARSYGGLGLGLAIVRDLVQLHGGSVQAASDGLGHGSTFVVRLPASRPSPVAAVEESPAELAPPGEVAPPRLAGVRVLVVDDERDGREMLATLLEVEGAEVDVAGSADEALQALQRLMPQVLISDIGMPRVDGYEFMRRLRQSALPGSRTLPAIALTAFARSEDAAKALRAGFQLHLPKPVEANRLFDMIRDALAPPSVSAMPVSAMPARRGSRP